MPKKRNARDIKRVFMDAHKHGQRALARGDLQGFADAVAVERSLILEQRVEIDKQRAAIARQRKVIKSNK